MGTPLSLSRSYLSPSAVEQVIYMLKHDRALERKIDDTYSLKRSKILTRYIVEKVPYLTLESRRKVYHELRHYFEQKYKFTEDDVSIHQEGDNASDLP